MGELQLDDVLNTIYNLGTVIEEERTAWLARLHSIMNTTVLFHPSIHPCRYCEAQRQVVLRVAQEGYDQDFWNYTE